MVKLLIFEGTVLAGWLLWQAAQPGPVALPQFDPTSLATGIGMGGVVWALLNRTDRKIDKNTEATHLLSQAILLKALAEVGARPAEVVPQATALLRHVEGELKTEK